SAVYSASTTATSSHSSTCAFSRTPAHVEHVAELNRTTSHGASGRAKSARSSCAGISYDGPPVGASVRRLARTTAATPTATTTIPRATRTRSTGGILPREPTIANLGGGDVTARRRDRSQFAVVSRPAAATRSFDRRAGRRGAPTARR